jgi:Ser/Thr protein kinase RdoA (MazF antagonist)
VLADDDAALAARDGAIASIPLLLDPHALGELLRDRELLTGSTDPAITYLRYKPGTSLVAAFRSNGTTGYAVAVADVARGRIERARRMGECAVVDEARGIALYLFPHDAGMTELGRIADDELYRKVLRRTIANGARPKGPPPRLLGYKPERRCVLRVTGTHDGVLRFYPRAELARAVAAHAIARSRGRLRVARTLGSYARYGTMMTEWLDGERIDLRVPGSLAAVGEALAELHRQGQGAALSGPTYLQRLSAMIPAIAALAPELRSEAEALVDRLCDRLRDASTTTLVHGDLHPGQVVVDGESIGLIDLDRITLADGRYDLGNLIAHTERDALIGDDGIDPVQLRDGLLEGYRSAGATCAESLDDFVAAGLLLMAAEPFRLRRENWRRETADLLSRARELADVAARVPFVATSRSGGPHDPAMPWLADALDPSRVESALRSTSIDGGEPDWRIRSARLVRHKPGRRALIEYRGEHDGAPIVLLGKSRARGVDAATVEVSWRLREAGLRAGTASGVVVPRPVAVLPELGMWLQERVDGVPALTALEGEDGVEIARRIADALHTLHCTGVPSRRAHGVDDELGTLRDRLGLLAAERPQWRERLERLLDASVAVARSMDPSEPTGVHRDFYHDQVLIAGDSVVIVDLDLYASGDPALDVGNFLGHLVEWSVRTRCDAEGMRDVREAFEDRYVERAGENHRERIRIYETLTLVRHVQLSTLFADRSHRTGDLLELCEERLAAVGTVFNRIKG